MTAWEYRTRLLFITAFIALISLMISLAHGAESSGILWLAYDAKMLTQPLQLAKTQRVTVVINPADGPARDADYVRAVEQYRTEPRITVKGYIDLYRWRNGRPSIKSAYDVRAEIMRYLLIYRITERDGYWFDDAFAERHEVRDLLRSLGLQLTAPSIVNPGEPVKPAHWLRSMGFQVCDYEGAYPAGIAASGSVWIMWVAPREVGLAYWLAQRKGVQWVGFDDVAARVHYQRPPDWWATLKTLR